MSLYRVDGDEENSRPMALSDTEVEVNDRRSASYWEHKSSRRNNRSSKVRSLVGSICTPYLQGVLLQGEASSHADTAPDDDELRERLNQHEAMPSSKWWI